MVKGSFDMKPDINRLIKEDRESPRTIFFVGDAMTDVYIHGKLGSCQEECYKLMEESYHSVPGGAANAERSLRNWKVNKISLFNEVLGPIKTRFMVNNKCVFRHDNDHCDFDKRTVRVKNWVTLNECINEINAVLISDYDKGLLTPSFLEDVIKLCKQYKIPCVVDAKRQASIYKGAIIKGNVDWMVKHGFGLTQNYVITQGGDSPYGMSHTNSTWNAWAIESRRDVVYPVVNHVGAGDCFASHLTLALAHDFSLKDAAAVAHSAGRVYVRHIHNRPPYPEEVREDVSNAQY